MSTSRPFTAKIIQHATGLGAPSAEEVQQRATELALIDGRVEYTERDWQSAIRELHGGHDTMLDSNEREMVSFVSERDMVITDLGHHVPNIPSENDESVSEELFAEGMDEAEHEQMLEAARAQRHDEEVKANLEE